MLPENFRTDLEPAERIDAFAEEYEMLQSEMGQLRERVRQAVEKLELALEYLEFDSKEHVDAAISLLKPVMERSAQSE